MQDFILTPLPLNELEQLILNQVRKALLEHIPNDQTKKNDELLTIDKAAEFLSVAIPTIYGYVHEKSIPFMKRRGRLYFNKDELLSWIKSSRRMTRGEIRQVAAESLER